MYIDKDGVEHLTYKEVQKRKAEQVVENLPIPKCVGNLEKYDMDRECVDCFFEDDPYNCCIPRLLEKFPFVRIYLEVLARHGSIK